MQDRELVLQQQFQEVLLSKGVSQLQVNDMSGSVDTRMRNSTSNQLLFPNRIGTQSDNDDTF